MLTHSTPDMSKVAGGWIPTEEEFFAANYLWGNFRKKISFLAPDVLLSRDVLSMDSCDAINTAMLKAPALAPVSVQGMQEIAKESDIGSFRATMWNLFLAKKLEELYYNIPFPRVKVCNDFTSTD